MGIRCGPVFHTVTLTVGHRCRIKSGQLCMGHVQLFLHRWAAGSDDVPNVHLAACAGGASQKPRLAAIGLDRTDHLLGEGCLVAAAWRRAEERGDLRIKHAVHVECDALRLRRREQEPACLAVTILAPRVIGQDTGDRTGCAERCQIAQIMRLQTCLHGMRAQAVIVGTAKNHEYRQKQSRSQRQSDGTDAQCCLQIDRRAAWLPRSR